jgi:hypothetical protein
MSAQVVGEDGECASDQVGRAVGMPARAPPVDLADSAT